MKRLTLRAGMEYVSEFTRESGEHVLHSQKTSIYQVNIVAIASAALPTGAAAQPVVFAGRP
jgi:hypothetical protein